MYIYIKYLLIIIIAFTSCGKQNKVNESSNISRNSSYCNIEFLPDSNHIQLCEYQIINEDFIYIIEKLIDDHSKCEQFDLGYHFSISMQKTILKDSLGVKSIQLEVDQYTNADSLNAISFYISRSYFKDYVSGGFGYFYFNNILFVIDGIDVVEVFKAKNTKQIFKYKNQPITIFDPPRWLYCLWNNNFYSSYSSPCGG